METWGYWCISRPTVLFGFNGEPEFSVFYISNVSIMTWFIRKNVHILSFSVLALRHGNNVSIHILQEIVGNEPPTPATVLD